MLNSLRANAPHLVAIAFVVYGVSGFITGEITPEDALEKVGTGMAFFGVKFVLPGTKPLPPAAK